MSLLKKVGFMGDLNLMLKNNFLFLSLFLIFYAFIYKQIAFEQRAFADATPLPVDPSYIEGTWYYKNGSALSIKVQELRNCNNYAYCDGSKIKLSRSVCEYDVYKLESFDDSPKFVAIEQFTSSHRREIWLHPLTKQLHLICGGGTTRLSRVP